MKNETTTTQPPKKKMARAPKVSRAKRGKVMVRGGKKAAASLQEFSVKQFCARYRLIRPDLTRLTGYSQRSVDQWATGDAPSTPARKQLREVVRLLDGLSEIMEPDSIGAWLKEPNDAFDGSTPLQVIERGESDRLWRMIYQIQTGEPL
jgi:hypothetical protein